MSERGDDTISKQSNTVALKRGMGLFSGVAMIVGTMIGSGIFISPGGLLRNTESVGTSLTVWGGCGILSMLGALCYSELGVMITDSGGEYVYLLAGLGAPIAFLFSWVQNIVLKPSSMAILSLTFAKYSCQGMFDECGPPEYILKITALICLVTVAIINSSSVRTSLLVQTWFTAAKLLAIVTIIIGGIYKLSQGNYTHLDTGFSGSTTNVGKIAIAFYNGLWSYDGWNNLNYCTEELKKPHVNLPRSIMIAVPLVTICYVLVNISYLTVMSAAEIISSPAVAITWAERVLGPAGFLIPIAVALSTFSALNGTMFSTGRLTFAAARNGHLVEILSMLNSKKLTPMPSIIFTTIIASIMILPSNVEQLIDFFSFAAWMFYGLTFLSLLIMRWTRKNAVRPYKVPIVVPIISLLISIYLVLAPIIDSPAIEFLYAFIFTISGILFYIPFVHFGIEPAFMKHVTVFFQLLFKAVPSETKE